MKSTDLNPPEKVFVVDRIIQLLTSFPDTKILSIVVNKQKVDAHIRSDSNTLYNYMIRLMAADHIKNFPNVEMIPDVRSIKVKSKNSLQDYLQIVLWYEKMSTTKLIVSWTESKNERNLQFVDFLAKIIADKYEDGINTPFAKLLPHIIHKKLFF